MSRKAWLVSLIVLLGTVFGSVAQAQGPQPGTSALTGTTFTYQGQLKNSGVAVNGTCNMQFGLWDSASGGLQVSGTTTQTVSSIAVNNGLFTASIDFGANTFNGNARYLAIAVACPSGSAYTTMTTRQTLTPAPYALFSSAPWVTSGNNISYNNGNVGIGTTNLTSKLEIAAQDGLTIKGYQPFLTLRDTSSWLNPRGVIQSAGGNLNFFPESFIGGQAPVIINNTGNVSISPGAPEPYVNGVPTVLKVGSPSGAVPFALRFDVAESGNPTLAWFETASGAIGQFSASTGTFVVGATSGKGLALNVNGGTTAMGINSDGNAGIGISGQNNVRLTVQSPGTTGSTYGLRVFNGNGSPTLMVKDDGMVYIGYVATLAVDRHLCIGSSGGGLLSDCGSAAEYVPTIDSGLGFPETADVVSIVSNVANPYGDDHGPFVVAKSTQACDDNLLGYITNPEKGADGKKLNDHYLPLAIYGYFPAKVTTANGAIRRGDPLTSSSKAGYAMKATGACKIIGNALEDANADGTIQVFAHLSENTAPQVAALQKENAALKVQNAQLETRVNTLEQQSASLQARLSALEQLTQANNPSHPDNTSNIAVIVIGALFGIVVVQKPWRRGE